VPLARRSRAVRLRRARALLAYWRDGRATFENYLTRRVVSAEPVVVQILSFFEEWREPADLAGELRQFTPGSVRRALTALVRHTLLLREGSAAAAQDMQLARDWRHWLPQASFHFATKDTPFVPERAWPARARRFLAESDPPPFFKTYPGRPRRRLPPVPAADGEFLQVLLARRTHRDFSGAPVSLQAIGTLLHYTWGAVGHVLSPTFGPLIHKTSPSGGARHPGEVYLVALDVEGLAPGIYHFNARDHALERLRRGQMRERLLAFAVNQRHVPKAAAVFLLTAFFPRSMWKYRSPRAYRVVTLDAGHLGQTFCLVATWLGLAPFTTAAMRDTAIEQALGLDGITESVLYMAGVGVPTGSEVTDGVPGAAGRRSPSRGRRRLRPGS
jgi:SagB-type dehydrogenase family enzyme